MAAEARVREWPHESDDADDRTDSLMIVDSLMFLPPMTSTAPLAILVSE